MSENGGWPSFTAAGENDDQAPGQPGRLPWRQRVQEGFLELPGDPSKSSAERSTGDRSSKDVHEQLPVTVST